MTPTHGLDFAPLTSRVRLKARLQAASANNLMVMAGTLGVLLVLVPASVFVGLLATGNATDAGGLVVLAMCFGAGVYVLVDVAGKSGDGAVLDRFARANELVLQRGSMARQYGGSLFADGSHAVHQSVRTRGERFVEVGERFPTTAPRSSRRQSRPQLFLRARLAGRATGGPGELVTPELHVALSRFAGAYTLEVCGDELTLYGNDRLEVERPGRVQEAFALVHELASRADAELVPAAPHGAPPAAAPEPPSPGIGRQPGSPRRPHAIIGWTLALVIGGAVVIAVIMSALDEDLRGEERAARLVVSLIVGAAVAVAARVGKAAMTPRSTDRGDAPE